MIPGHFDYHRPKKVADAVSLLVAHPGEARVVAGGHSLIPMMKLRLAAPEHLIDLQDVSELKGIAEENGHLVIGAMTTQAELIAQHPHRSEMPASCARRRSRSQIPKCETAARSAAMSPMAIPATTCRR